ncbi:MAG: hypothetical protein J0H57_24260 [Rhodospirillales bacterium]|nr:hypothetical protein [Rhodospirillales bacterium]
MGRVLRACLLALAGLLVLVVMAVVGLVLVLRPGPQHFACDTDRFLYGSVGGSALGIPYPIFMVLPRVFPDLVAQYATAGYGPAKPGWGGYGAFGVAWEQGQALPAGFSIDHRVYDRVTITCALCHTATWRESPEGDQHIVPGGPAHALDLGNLVHFLVAAARDDRFNSARLLPEIALNFPLNWVEAKLYGWVLIPVTRFALDMAGRQLAWTETRPAWGPGRDDAFNLPKFILTRTPLDDTVGNTDFPALWRMRLRDGMPLHAGGEGVSLYGVTATSALGVGSLPLPGFHARNDWIVAFLRDLPPPPFPDPVDPSEVSAGRAVYTTHCAACHEPGGGRTGSVIPLQEIGTDPEHVRTWQEQDAARMNRLTRAIGMGDAPLRGASGYVARPLTGVWLLAPYLHNGSVPTLADLLRPPADRPAVFWRGYDVLDRVQVGFVTTGKDAEARGFRFDTRLRGNGNGGHVYGTELDDDAKRALLAFLKTQ